MPAMRQTDRSSETHKMKKDYIQEHSETSDLRQGVSGPDPDSVSGLRIRTPYQGFGSG